MNSNPEVQRVMSLRLSRVLGDIGITRQMVNMRRNICLFNEKAMAVDARGFGRNWTCYHVGSQTEGTTTLGMESDMDVLSSPDDSPVLLDWSEWQPSPQCSLLVLQDGSSPPQHCNLLLLRRELPMPATLGMIPKDINVEVDMEGRIPRPGHWPTPDILEQSKHTGTFLVPQGHAESCHPQLEWRFSTSLIERLLMSNLNMTKVKAYIFLKILRMTYFKPVVGDRLSIFHIKTALLFTIESYPPELWQEDNLLHCIIFCLTTLKRWYRMHYCPHYTISGVDLFVGKLRRFELPQVSAMLSDMIENITVYVVHIEMDELGRRMLKLIGATNTHIKTTRCENILATYEEAATILDQTEALLHPDVWYFNKSRRNAQAPSKTVLRRFLDQPVSEIIRTSVAFSVSFHKREVHCVPKHLVFEMHRTINQEDKQHRILIDGWMDNVISDSVPFLYYLQYLAYRKLGYQDKKLTAMWKLRHYINHDNKGYGHPDTAANMLGHCCEMENRLDLAWQCYSVSLKNFPYNNAAKWHMMILLYQAHAGIRKMAHHPEYERVMSLRLSRVLSDIGVTRQMVTRRRNSWLAFEKIKTVSESIPNRNRTFYTFGSQSEGTTTLGMESDVDCLRSLNDSPVFLDLSEWQPSPNYSLLVLQDESSPPQHCNLQFLRSDLPLPATLGIIKDADVEVDLDGRVLLKNTFIDSILQKKYGPHFKKQGPSRSTMKDVDSVYAYHCARQPKQCQFLFHRPRPGHWPTPDLLEQAKQTGTFLVPQGHAESCHPKLEWRFSTSRIERLLMFNLNLTKVKAYIFLKVLRKTYFKPVVGDRLSTFHIKTALLFTIESYPPEIWQEDNLLKCVIFCLTTLKRWCRMHYCPHYTISGVDLFVGKLKKFELPQISAMLSDMIENIMVYVVNIEMDGLGRRMLKLIDAFDARNTHITSTRYENTVKTAQNCCDNIIRLSIMLSDSHFIIYGESASIKSTIEKTIVSFNNILMQNDLSIIMKDLVRANLLFLFNQLATFKASKCIELHQPVTAHIYNLYQASLDSDLTSSRLKFASMLYCTDQYEEAAAVLEHIEALLHPDVWQFSFSYRRQPKPSNNFLSSLLDRSVSEVIRTSVAFSVAYMPQEVHCVPEHLVFEMHRTINQEDIQHRHQLCDKWMDSAVTDSIPFLYYLQYLTYRQLGHQDRKLTAMWKLRHYINHDSEGYGHIETAINMLGHCCELENRLDMAWQCYSVSRRAYPHNNAANWHIMRLLYQAQFQA
ncbi:uncharacterized protein LOC128204823 [Mya arenaria]|uniref:uncharacterized protein LOC128204823 n=1 Tax=Mya arenaria TaxID=6604 RepID=UPI0022E0F260|nr:uncharacterized protein LOC128204823 [Mya arenaria]